MSALPPLRRAEILAVGSEMLQPDRTDTNSLDVTAGLNDPRVTYWEPAKWVARLRAAKTDANPLLLKTNMDAGHGGASGRFDRLKEVALVQAFALQVTGRVDADQADGAATRQT